MSYVIGICGGSGSGKTTFANNLKDALIAQGVEVEMISYDDYYKHEPGMTPEERTRYNFDVPEALDGYLLVEDLAKLKAGLPADTPLYDMKTQSRRSETRRVNPAKVIIVEGILVFAEEELRHSFDLTIYVDAPVDVRLLRRVVRDIDERGHSAKTAAALYLNSVRDAHLAYVEPYRTTSDIVINDAFDRTMLDVISSGIVKITS